MKIILGLSVVFLLMIAWLFTPGAGDRGLPANNMAHAVADNAESVSVADRQWQGAGSGIARVVIPRAADGHFYVDAQLGPATIRFLVDTGASKVALSKVDAQRAGIFPAAGDYVDQARTANGAVAVKPVLIDRIRIGPFEARDVEGAVIDGDLGVSLLGQSWLRRMGSVTIRDDQLILN